MKKLLANIAVVCLLCMFGGTAFPEPGAGSESPVPFEIPRADINIDGNISDWSSIEPVVTDAVNDQDAGADFAGTDLQKLYLAKDDTFLYVGMTLFDGNPKTDIHTQYGFEAIQSLSGSVPGDHLAKAGFRDGNWYSAVHVRGVGDTAHYPSSYVGVGANFIEWKVLLSDMGSMNDKYVFAYIHVFENGENPEYPVSDSYSGDIRIEETNAGPPPKEPQQPSAQGTTVRWYFAEGYTGPGFQEWLCLQNPNEVPVDVTIEYRYRGGGGTTQHVTVGADTRETVDVNAVVGPNREVSAIVSSDPAIIAERPMYFNFNGIDDGHTVVGANAPDTAWYFAEGYTGAGFQEWLTLQNPNSENANVTVEYTYRSGGGTSQNITIGPNTRETVDVNAVVGSGREVSVKITSDKPIVAERPMYFKFGSINGGHCVVGANMPYDQWLFAEGYTGAGYQEWLTLQNPNDVPANVRVVYLFKGGDLKTQDLVVAPHTRETVDVNAVVGSNKEVSMSVLTDESTPIVAERPMYFNFSGINGGHDVFGSNNPLTTYYFAEGYTGNGFQEWLCLYNLPDMQEDVTITYLFRGGGRVVQDITLNGSGRTTIDVNAVVGHNKEVSIIVEAHRPFAAIVAERPMYFNFGGINGGHDVVGY